MPSLKAMAREAQTKPQSTALKQPTSRKRAIFKSAEKVEESDTESETESESGSDLEEVTTVADVPLRKLNGQKPNLVGAKGVVQHVKNKDDSRRDGDPIVSSKRNGISIEGVSQRSDQSTEESDGESGSSGSGSSSERGSDESDAESSGSDTDSEDASQPSKLKPAVGNDSSHTEENSQALSTGDRAIPKYDPPEGFAVIPKISHAKVKVTDIFSQSNLAGKQLWYITAPSSVPISAIKQVSLQDIQLGKPALSVHARHYGFVQEQAEAIGLKKVLIPGGNNGVYVTGHKAIDRTLHLQQIVELHKNEDSSNPNPAQVSPAKKSSARKQPDDLKMRFRPIGFGRGKVGTIGSSSPSTGTSRTTDAETDYSMDDAPPGSRPPPSIDQTNARLYGNTARSSASQEETSSSGEEVDSPKTANSMTPGQINSVSKSDTSSEEINSDDEDLQKVTSASKKLTSPYWGPVKRKIDALLSDSSPLDSAPILSKSKVAVKNTSGKETAPSPVKPGRETNGSESARKRRAVSSSPSKLTQVPQTLRSVPTSNPIDIPIQSVPPISPPRRQSSILPPQKWSRSPDAPRVVKANGRSPEGSLAEAASLQPSSSKNNRKSLNDGSPSIDLVLSDRARKQEARRLKKNERGQKLNIQKGESINSSTIDLLDESTINLSVSRNAQERTSPSRLHPKSTVDKTLYQNTKLGQTTNTEESSKKATKPKSALVIHDQNGERAGSNQESYITVPAVRKESVILPPKFNRSISR